MSTSEEGVGVEEDGKRVFKVDSRGAIWPMRVLILARHDSSYEDSTSEDFLSHYPLSLLSAFHMYIVFILYLNY